MMTGRNILIYFFMFCSGQMYKACERDPDPFYRDQMRNFVEEISNQAKNRSPGFIIIPQNGVSLVTVNGEPDGEPHSIYLGAIDGQGQEDLLFGYSADNRATPENETEYLMGFLRVCEQNGVEVLVTDYCSDSHKMDESYNRNADAGFVSYAAPERELNVIPSNEPALRTNSDTIRNLSEAGNFLYLINPEGFISVGEMTEAVTATNYDLLIADLYFGDVQLNPDQLKRLKKKANGGVRLVIAYMSIGEAEDYRDYWIADWEPGDPEWLDKENPNWEGNYRVKYWDPEWQELILGSDESYLDRIIAAGFDGVYLDIVEAYEYYE